MNLRSSKYDVYNYLWFEMKICGSAIPVNARHDILLMPLGYEVALDKKQRNGRFYWKIVLNRMSQKIEEKNENENENLIFSFSLNWNYSFLVGTACIARRKKNITNPPYKRFSRKSGKLLMIAIKSKVWFASHFSIKLRWKMHLAHKYRVSSKLRSHTNIFVRRPSVARLNTILQ